MQNTDTNSLHECDIGIAIRNVHIFDGEKLIDADTILFCNGIIMDVGKDIAIPSNYKTIDGHSGTLLPGLIDSHVHVAPMNLEQALVFGVTTEIDMANEPKVLVSLRMMAATRHNAADIRSASRAAHAPNSGIAKIIKNLPTVANPEEAKAFVNDRINEEADFIKVILDPGGVCLFSKDTLQALIDEAHIHHRKVMAHIEKQEAGYMFIQCGGDVIAHVLSDLNFNDEIMTALKERKSFVIPTLRVSANSTADGNAGKQALINHPSLLPYLDKQTYNMICQDTSVWPSRFDFEGAKKTVQMLHKAGIPILAGTDATPGIPVQQNGLSALAGHGLSLHQELELLVSTGFTPSEALASATSIPADCFGLNDRGRIKRGLRADLLLVAGKPTDNIKETREIVSVWRSGVQFDREEYGKFLVTSYYG